MTHGSKEIGKTHYLPEVPQQSIRELIDEAYGDPIKFIKQTEEKIRDQNKALFERLTKFYLTVRVEEGKLKAEEFLFGAYFIYESLSRELAKNGKKPPVVSHATLKSLQADNRGFRNALVELVGVPFDSIGAKEEGFDGKWDQAQKMSGYAVGSWPETENTPLLETTMTISRVSLASAKGATVAYELLRRQAEADNLEMQFGW